MSDPFWNEPPCPPGMVHIGINTRAHCIPRELMEPAWDAMRSKFSRGGTASGPEWNAAMHRIDQYLGIDVVPLGQTGRYPISSEQRTVHMASEAFAVFAVVPFMFFLATRRHLPRWARWGSAIIGAGTLVIDGGLLVKHWTNDGEEGG